MSADDKSPRDLRREQERGLGVPSIDQGVASGEFVTLTPEQVKARNRRNIVLALSIVAFVILVFFITLAKIKENGVAPL
jgi:hypothetical protein